MSDTHLQDGAAAAAAAGGAAGGVGERHSTDSPRKINQRAASCHGCPFGVCVHGGQLRRPPDENPQPHTFYITTRDPARLPVEALGRHFRVSASLSSAPQMTCCQRQMRTMKGLGLWDWHLKGGPIQEVESSTTLRSVSEVLSLYHVLNCGLGRIKEKKKSLDGWQTFYGGTSTCCRSEWSVVEGGAERTAHLISLLNEFVYTWKTLFFSLRSYCFEFDSIGIVLKSLLLFNTTYYCILFVTVTSWQCSAALVSQVFICNCFLFRSFVFLSCQPAFLFSWSL